MAVPQIDYYDPTLKKVQQGYLIGDKTYMDEAGTQRIPVGSLVATQGGTYMLGASGGTRLNDSTALPAEYYGTVQPTGTGATQPAAQQTSTFLSATDQSSYINDIYDARKSQQLSALDSAYKQSGNSLDLAKSQIPQQYQAERNQTAATSEIQRRNFNQYAAAQGLNNGANAQANLAFATKQQGALGNINMQEGNALANIETQRANLAIQYQAAVAEAISQNDYQRASSLLEEARRVDDSYIAAQNAQTQLNLEAEERDRAQLEQRAATLAEFGDFSGYAALGYTDSQIAGMSATWKLLNPELAKLLGDTQAITPDTGGDYVPPPTPVPEAPKGDGSLFITVQRALGQMQRSGGYTPASMAAYIVQRLDNGNITPEEAIALAKQYNIPFNNIISTPAASTAGTVLKPSQMPIVKTGITDTGTGAPPPEVNGPIEQPSLYPSVQGMAKKMERSGRSKEEILDYINTQYKNGRISKSEKDALVAMFW